MMLTHLIQLVFDVFRWLLIARILGSWVPQWQNHRIMQFICYYTEPYLSVFRRILPPLGVLDLSPLLAFFALYLLEYGILSLLV